MYDTEFWEVFWLYFDGDIDEDEVRRRLILSVETGTVEDVIGCNDPLYYEYWDG